MSLFPDGMTTKGPLDSSFSASLATSQSIAFNSFEPPSYELDINCLFSVSGTQRFISKQETPRDFVRGDSSRYNICVL